MSQLLKKNSAKTKVSVNAEDLLSGGLPENLFAIIANPKMPNYSKLMKKVTEALATEGLTDIGIIYGPARPNKAARKALADKKSR